MASLYHSLGSHVVLVELSEQLCPFLDKEVGRSLGKILSGKGIELKLGAKVLDGKVGEEDVALRLQREQQEEVRANSCLVAIGRRPNARGLGLEEVGVKINAAGQIEVDDTFCSAVPSIFAIGDVIDGPMLAHKASEEAVALVDALAGKASAPVCYMAMPSVVYTDPEVASVGLSEEECVKLQRPIKVGRAYFKGNGRARCSQSEEGFAKVIGDAQTGKLLGVHLVGAAASELIGIGVLALSQKLEVKDLARVPLPHPTLSELLKEAAQAAL
jgi:dihydrolipoamide dehydrogenase